MNKKRMLSLLLCLVLGASLFALPAFADSTVIVIGGSVGQTQSGSIGAQSPLNSISAINSSGAVIVSGTANAPVQTPSAAGSASLGSVIVMPNGSVQKISSQPVQQTQTTTQAQAVTQPQSSVSGQGVQISSAQAQTAASAAPAVVMEQSGAAQTFTTAQALDGLAAELLKQINQKRTANGLSTLSYSADLQASADIRAKESVQSFSHLRPDGRGCETAVTVDYMVTGENLIQVTSEFATADIMMDTWMNSPTHRNNILLASFTKMAVGIYVSNGTTYVSTVFVG